MLRFFGSQTNKRDVQENKPALRQVVDFTPCRMATVSGHTQEICALNQLPDGRLISIAKSTDGKDATEIRIWDLSTGVCERNIDDYLESNFSSSRAFERPLQNGNVVFTYFPFSLTSFGTGMSLVIYNPQIGTYKRGGGYYGPFMWETSIWLELHNERLAIVSARDKKYLISILSKSLSKIRVKIEQKNEITSLIQLKSGNLVSGACDGTMHVFDSSDGRLLKVINNEPSSMERLSIITLMQHGNDCLIALTLEKIEFWTISSGECAASICLNERNERYEPHELHQLPDGRLAVIGLIASIDSDDKKICIKLYDVVDYRCIQTFLTSDFTNIARVSMKVLADGRLAITEGIVIRIWDIGFRPMFELDIQSEEVPLKLLSSTPSHAHASLQIEEPLEAASVLSHSAFEQMVHEAQLSRARLPSEVDIAQDLGRLRQRMQHLDGSEELSSEERRRLRARIADDKRSENLLIEHQNILMNPSLKGYYHALQTHVSELMVASLGVGSGYIPVDNSKSAKAVEWICCAISSVFPGVSIATSVISSGASYLDAHYRKLFLDKIRVLGATITEAEILGEQVARLLVRAHYHAGHEISALSAEHDAKALIAVIVRAEIPFIRDKETATRLVDAIWGDTAFYCTDPIPRQNVVKTSMLQNKIGVQDVGASSVASMSPALISSEARIQELTHQLEAERNARMRLEKEFGQHRAQTALKAEVASRNEVSDLRQRVNKLTPSESQGGLKLMSRSQFDAESETKQRASEKRLAHMEAHVGVLTTEVQSLQEKVMSSRSDADDRMRRAVKHLPKKNLFSTPVSAAQISGQSARQTGVDSKAWEDERKALFNI